MRARQEAMMRERQQQQQDQQRRQSCIMRCNGDPTCAMNCR
jgi:hypothetical protein